MSRTVQALEEAARRLSTQAITGADVAHAFDTLLDAWRSLRTAEIAGLCESLSARLAPNLVVNGLDARTQQEQAVAWASAFRDHSPLGLAPLLVDFERSCRERPQPRLVFPRADALSNVRDDPRIAPVMLRALSTIAGGSAWQKVLLRYFRALEASEDPRAIPELSRMLDAGGQGLSTELSGSLREFVFERAPQTLSVLQARFADGVPALPHELRALVGELEERIALLDPKIALDSRRITNTAQRGDPDSLLRDAYASPDDDAARLVLADALMERGDPRGEFIVLQMRRAAGESTPKMHAREKALLKANTRAWLGPLAAVVAVKSAVFERGFLARCEATAKSRAIAELHYHHPEWATVSAIAFRGSPLVTPAMKSLREASGLDEFAIKKLHANGGHPRLERLEVTITNHSAPGEVFAATPLPSLRHLSLSIWADANDLPWLWKASWKEHLETLHLRASNDASGWVAALAADTPLKQITIGPQAATTITLTNLANGPGVAVTLASEDSHWKGSAPSFLIRHLREAIERLKGSSLVHELRIELHEEKLDDAQRAEIENSLKSLPERRRTIVPW